MQTGTEEKVLLLLLLLLLKLKKYVKGPVIKTLKHRPAWSESVSCASIWENITVREDSKREVWCWNMRGEYKEIFGA